MDNRPPALPHFLLFSPERGTHDRLARLLADRGHLESADQGRDSQASPIHTSETPRLVFIDFSLDPSTGTGQERLAAARRLCQYAAGQFPSSPRIALVRYDNGFLAVEALRAGASDCIDLDNPGDAERTLDRLLQAPAPGPSAARPRGRSILILGARQGLGVTTLASHLASMALGRPPAGQTGLGYKPPQHPEQQVAHVCLLDLGIPTRDGLLYLGAPEGFHFLDAARSLHRLDDTLLDSALSHDGQGLKILSFPASLEEMRQITHTDALALFNRLHDFFSLLVVDAGGLDNLEFTARLIQAADHVWIVADQGLGGLLSLAEFLDALKSRGVEPERLRLVINRYDIRYGLAAPRIAKKFDLPLLGTLPEATLAIWSHLNQSKRLTRDNPRHPYVKAVGRLLDLADHGYAVHKPASGLRALWNTLDGVRRHLKQPGETR